MTLPFSARELLEDFTSYPTTPSFILPHLRSLTLVDLGEEVGDDDWDPESRLQDHANAIFNLAESVSQTGGNVTFPALHSVTLSLQGVWPSDFEERLMELEYQLENLSYNSTVFSYTGRAWPMCHWGNILQEPLPDILLDICQKSFIIPKLADNDAHSLQKREARDGRSLPQSFEPAAGPCANPNRRSLEWNGLSDPQRPAEDVRKFLSRSACTVDHFVISFEGCDEDEDDGTREIADWLEIRDPAQSTKLLKLRIEFMLLHAGQEDADNRVWTPGYLATRALEALIADGLDFTFRLENNGRVYVFPEGHVDYSVQLAQQDSFRQITVCARTRVGDGIELYTDSVGDDPLPPM
ncbi:hypothetical protein B0H14DRAFT_2637456 [Mycena olivaceomarginata]|nr:hypothetical protein B0H14DRAFT_2637456 [Mycena olivaceomarginata]